jgi:H+/Cl- antiporter ClcA
MADKEEPEGIASSAGTSLGVAIGEREPKIRHIILIALVTVTFALAYFAALSILNTAFWKNDFVTANRWTIPVLVLLFSLLVGLCGRYLRAPNSIRGGMQEVAKEGGFHIDYSTFPGAVLASFFSLLSGASVGPEGPLTILVAYIAGWLGSKLKLAEETMLGFILAGLASAFNGLIGNPLFTAVFATELQAAEAGDKKGTIQFLTWNLVAGAIGYIFYALIGFPAFASSIPFTPVAVLTIGYAIEAVVLGIIGAIVALFIGISFQSIGAVMDRIFKDRFIVRVMSAGIIIAIVAYFIPELMFSGESQIGAIIANPAAYGVLVLLAFAILKVLLFALSFKGGYLGGPIFPSLFAATMVALAISLLFPSVPVALLFTCTVAATIAIVLSAPLAAILLTLVIATSNTYELGYMSLATATALIIGATFKQRMARRAARQAQSRESSST